MSTVENSAHGYLRALHFAFPKPRVASTKTFLIFCIFYSAVCFQSQQVVPNAPYIVDPDFVFETNRCDFVVHGGKNIRVTIFEYLTIFENIAKQTYSIVVILELLFVFERKYALEKICAGFIMPGKISIIRDNLSLIYLCR